MARARARVASPAATIAVIARPTWSASTSPKIAVVVSPARGVGRAVAGGRSSALGVGRVGEVDHRRDQVAPEGKILVVPRLRERRRQQPLEEAQRVGGRLRGEGGERDGAERRSEGDDIRERRLLLRREPCSMAGPADTDQDEIGSEWRQRVEHAAKTGCLADGAVVVARGQPAGGSLSEGHVPVARGGRGRCKHLRSQPRRRQIDTAARGRVGPARRTDVHVHDRRRDAAELILEVEPREQLAGGDADRARRRHRRCRRGRNDPSVPPVQRSDERGQAARQVAPGCQVAQFRRDPAASRGRRRRAPPVEAPDRQGASAAATPGRRPGAARALPAGTTRRAPVRRERGRARAGTDRPDGRYPRSRR